MSSATTGESCEPGARCSTSSPNWAGDAQLCFFHYDRMSGLSNFSIKSLRRIEVSSAAFSSRGSHGALRGSHGALEGKPRRFQPGGDHSECDFVVLRFHRKNIFPNSRNSFLSNGKVVPRFRNRDLRIPRLEFQDGTRIAVQGVNSSSHATPDRRAREVQGKVVRNNTASTNG